MASRTGHLSVQKGKRVGAKLLDGSIVYGKFYEKKGKYIYLIDGKGQKNRYLANNLVIQK